MKINLIKVFKNLFKKVKRFFKNLFKKRNKEEQQIYDMFSPKAKFALMLCGEDKNLFAM